MRRRALMTVTTGCPGRAFAWEFAAQELDRLLTDRSRDALRLVAAGVARAYGSRVDVRECDLEDEAELAARALGLGHC